MKKAHITAAAILAVLLTGLAPAAFAATPATTDLTDTFLSAGAAVNGLQVTQIAGIVIIRGRTPDKTQAELLSQFAASHGYDRVANLVQVLEHNDKLIARTAERELSVQSALDGCHFSVHSQDGIVRVAGTVQHELQKDVAMQVLRRIDGVRGVEMALNKF